MKKAAMLIRDFYQSCHPRRQSSFDGDLHYLMAIRLVSLVTP